MSLLMVFLLWIVVEYCNGNACDYELSTAESRNIIFVGRSRSGKTTLIEVLKNKDYNPGLLTILRGTEEAKLQSFTMASKKLNNNLHFNIMDTPGLFERSNNIDDQRTNEVILETIKKCIDMEITKINHVYFVMSIQYGLNPDDIKSFELFTQLFVGMEDKISIILSFSQAITDGQYAHYINQFKTINELKTINNLVNGRIFFLGAAQQGEIMDNEKLKANVYKQREALFEHIIRQNQTYNVKELQIYKDNISFLQKIRESLSACCQSMKSCIDLQRFDNFVRHYTPQVPATNDNQNAQAQQDDNKPVENKIDDVVKYEI